MEASNIERERERERERDRHLSDSEYKNRTSTVNRTTDL
jgi:hypothetical protein